MNPTLDDVETLARRAGEILREGYGGPLHIDYKGVINPVTEFDHRSETVLLEGIRSRFPDHRIVTEESGEVRGQASHTWYIDPLDGTVNFSHGIPIFAVSIAYFEDERVKLGVVFDPMRNECFKAEAGKGAWLNTRPIEVSQAAELSRSLLATGFPYNIRTTTTNNLDYFARFSVRAQAVRRLGAAALDFCYVAAGRFDGYWELVLYPWDMAAGMLIAAEAGALVSDIHGGPDYFKPPQSVIVANPAIHAQMLNVLLEK